MALITIPLRGSRLSSCAPLTQSDDRSHCRAANANNYLTSDWKEKHAFASPQSDLLGISVLILKVQRGKRYSHKKSVDMAFWYWTAFLVILMVMP